MGGVEAAQLRSPRQNPRKYDSPPPLWLNALVYLRGPRRLDATAVGAESLAGNKSRRR